MNKRPLLYLHAPACGIGSLLLALAGAALAQDLGRVGLSGAMADGVTRSSATIKSTMSMTHTIADPLATAGAAPVDIALPSRYPVAQQTMLWAHRGAWAAGIGVEQRQRYEPVAQGQSPMRESGMLVGLALRTGDNSRLFMQLPLSNARWPSALPNGRSADEALFSEPRQLRMGLVFQKNDQLADLRRGLLMKVELSGQTTLSIKPRAGRIGVTLASRW